MKKQRKPEPKVRTLTNAELANATGGAIARPLGSTPPPPPPTNMVG